MLNRSSFRTTAHRLIVGGLVLAVALASNGIAQQQTKSVKEQLVGTWLLTSWEQDMPNNQKLHRFGDNPKGYNVFEANGRFFVMFASPEIVRAAQS